MLQSEIFSNALIPLITFIHIFVTPFAGVVDAWLIAEFRFRLALLS